VQKKAEIGDITPAQAGEALARPSRPSVRRGSLYYKLEEHGLGGSAE
jgi:hypothetical protein